MAKQRSRIGARGIVLYHQLQPPVKADVLQLLLSKYLWVKVLKGPHDDHDPQDIDRTGSPVRQPCYLPCMRHDEWFIQQCHRCILAKAAQPEDAFRRCLTPSKPLEIVATDFTVLEIVLDGRESVLIVTNIYSKFAQAYATCDQRVSKGAKPLTREVVLHKWSF